MFDSLRFAPDLYRNKRTGKLFVFSAVRHSNHDRRAVAARAPFFHYPVLLTTVTLRASVTMKDVNR